MNNTSTSNIGGNRGNKIGKHKALQFLTDYVYYETGDEAVYKCKPRQHYECIQIFMKKCFRIVPVKFQDCNKRLPIFRIDRKEFSFENLHGVYFMIPFNNPNAYNLMITRADAEQTLIIYRNGNLSLLEAMLVIGDDL
jgi:hypothetical protein